MTQLWQNDFGEVIMINGILVLCEDCPCIDEPCCGGVAKLGDTLKAFVELSPDSEEPCPCFNPGIEFTMTHNGSSQWMYTEAFPGPTCSGQLDNIQLSCDPNTKAWFWSMQCGGAVASVVEVISVSCNPFELILIADVVGSGCCAGASPIRRVRFRVTITK